MAVAESSNAGLLAEVKAVAVDEAKAEDLDAGIGSGTYCWRKIMGIMNEIFKPTEVQKKALALLVSSAKTHSFVWRVEVWED